MNDRTAPWGAQLPGTLVAFASGHGLKIGTIEDLIGLPPAATADRIVTKGRPRRSVESAHGGTFELHVYETKTEAVFEQSRPRQGGDPVVRTRPPCWCACIAVNALADLLRRRRGRAATGSLIEKSMRMNSARKWRGVIVLIADPQPNIGVSTWIAQKQGQEAAPRRPRPSVAWWEIGVGSQILRDPGRGPTWCCSRNAPAPPSRYVGLRGISGCLRIVRSQRRIG